MSISFCVLLIYLEFLGTTINFDLHKYGSAVPSMTQEVLNQIPFPVPLLKEQTTIANYLDRKTAEIDDLIAKKEELLILYEEEKTAIINQAVTKGINPDVKLKDSGIEWLCKIHEHWEVNKIKYMCKTTKGYAFKTNIFTKSGIPVVKASNIKIGTIINISEYISENDSMIYDNVKLKHNDLILSTVGSSPDVVKSAVGQIALIPKNLEGALLNQNTVRFELILNTGILFDFFVNAVKSYTYRKYLDINAHGTANQASLNVADMLFYTIAFPNREEQNVIVQYIKKETTRIDAKTEKTKKLIGLQKEYRTALISEVVTGKIKVTNETEL